MNIISHIRNKRRYKVFSVLTVFTFLYQLVFPIYSYGLTGGPSQPEVQSFEPVGTSQMVDLATGDFNYNIPLLDVGGYPVNLAYHAGIGMDQEASWVGLGWNINPGVLNRNMRGLPDDFNGDEIETKQKLKTNTTIGLNTPLGFEVYGKDLKKSKLVKLLANKNKLQASFGVFYNNYRGVGFEHSIGLKGPLNSRVGITANSHNGVDIKPSISLSGVLNQGTREEMGVGMRIGASYNSRGGLRTLNYGVNAMSNETSVGGSSNRSYNFTAQTYVPNISMEQRTAFLGFNASVGGALFGTHPNQRFEGYITSQWLKSREQSKKAYGYIYEQDHFEDDVLLDFNREKDGTYSENTTNLPLANHTYDVYSASGQGIGGSFRAYRGDVPMLHSDVMTNNSTSAQIGLEFGPGGVAHLGGDFMVNWHKTETGKWDEGNEFWQSYGAVDASDAPIDYEPYYFKSAGEMTAMDEDYFAAIGEDKNVRPDLNYNRVDNALYNEDGTLLSEKYIRLDDKENNIKKNRESRHMLLSSLDANQANKFALDKEIRNYAESWTYPTSSSEFAYTSEPRNARADKGHHFSEMKVKSQDGSTYVYGIPAYNNTTVERTFNVKGRTFDCSIGQVTYATGDDSKSNSLGSDEYFYEKTTPEYAHSYLLTSLLSSDYVDLTGNGVSDDDLGTAVKFNYSKVHENYRWRVPYNDKSANWQIGLHTDFDDDKGSYIYGEKEIWYMHSIETKSHVAVFITSSDRKDALGVAGEQGGLATDMRQRKLDQIKLYSKQDYIRNGANAVPIKVVHFEYKYTLCDGIDNHDGTGVEKGKLTLDKIYFTYGTSNRGRLSAYEFKYSTVNPNYNLKGSDWWGTYKANQDNSCDYSDNISNADFPYTEQDYATAKSNASAWALTEISLPSGGTIKVEYESDDYAYVQDKRAMNMVKIKGFGPKSEIGSYSNKLFDKKGFKMETHEICYFDLADPITGTNANQEFYRKYLEDLSEIQFTVFADVDNTNKYEFVKGYADIDFEIGYGLVSNGTVGWVALKRVKIGDKHAAHKNRLVHPVSRAIWNFARLYTPHLTHPYANSGGSNQKAQVLGLAPLLTDLRYMASGFNKTLESKKFGKEIKLVKSWIRLQNPNKTKFGGGHRVKKLSMSDNWGTMGAANTGATDFEYGQEYFYTKKELQSDGSEMTISSGVASYEPMIGGDENPFKESNVITSELKLAPDNYYMQETPMGESFFPGAVVVYSQVKVQALQHQNVDRTATGYTVNEFYTAKDYPTIVKDTDIEAYTQEPEPFFSLFSFVKESEARVVQGYTIELNDMHGKPKSQHTYNQEGTEISGSITYYKTDESGDQQRLDNTVLTIDKDNNIEEKLMGVEVDFAVDNRSMISRTNVAGAQVNTDVTIIIIATVPIPAIYPSFSQTRNEFRSAVTTKVIKKYGIVDKTVVFKNGSSLESQNLLYDAETGAPLLSKTQNEFRDYTYSFTYPAYWHYNEMGPAYRNQGLHVYGVSLNSLGNITFPNSLDVKDYLIPGDRCMLIDSKGLEREVYVYDGLDGIYNLIGRNGERVQLAPADDCIYAGEGPFQLKVIESSYSNTTGAPMASVITHTNPLVQVGQTYQLVFNDILDASAVEYRDDWKTHIEYMNYTGCTPNAMHSEWLDFLNCLLTNQNSTDVFVLATDVLRFPTLGDDQTKKRKNSVETLMDINGDLSFDGCDSLFFLKDGSSTWEYIDPNNSSNIQSKGMMLDVELDYPASNTFNNLSCLSDPNNLDFMNSNLLSAVESKILEKFPGSQTQTDLSNSTISDYYYFVNRIKKNKKHYFTVDIHHNIYHVGCPLSFVIDDPDGVYTSIASFDNFYANGDGTYVIEMTLDKCDGTQQTYLTDMDLGCLSMFDCTQTCHQEFVEHQINPYTTGMEGNWRAYKNYKYLENRNYTANVDPKNDGTYIGFDDFWIYDNNVNSYVKNTNGNVNQWVSPSEITKITPFGNEVENKDALNTYSSAVYGYEHSVPKAVASNAKYQQIAYDGFEDYTYMNDYMPIACVFDHWSYRYRFTTEAAMDTEVKHSGNQSLKVNSGQEVYVDRQLDDPTVTAKSFDENYVRKVSLDDDLGVFKPEEGDYILSAWIKEDRTADHTNFSDAKIQVIITKSDNTTVTYDLNAAGLIIEGWQRIEGTFSIPAGAKNIRVNLVSSTEVDSWFDDIRILPKEAGMKTYAYDARTLRLMAELDENNYATFYEYDQEGTLIRLKKETAKGIATLKENRNHYYKK